MMFINTQDDDLLPTCGISRQVRTITKSRRIGYLAWTPVKNVWTQEDGSIKMVVKIKNESVK